MHPKSWTRNSIILLEGQTPELRRSLSFQFHLNALLDVVGDEVINCIHEIPDVPVFGFLPVKHFALQDAKVILHQAVDHTVAFSGHALPDTVFLQAFHETAVLVLPALVGMQDRALGSGICAECFLQHVVDLRQVGRSRQIPCHNFLSIGVQNWRQITLLTPQMELRHVGKPFLVGLPGSKIPMYQVVRNPAHCPFVGAVSAFLPLCAD